jgi:hypothetical protein
MARPAYEATDKSRKAVRILAGLGTRHEEIALMLDITPKTLRKHFREELDRGATEANAKVMETLYKMATSGKNTAAAIFWAKTRCGLRERGPSKSSGDQQQQSSLILRVE